MTRTSHEGVVCSPCGWTVGEGADGAAIPFWTIKLKLPWVGARPGPSLLCSMAKSEGGTEALRQGVLWGAMQSCSQMPTKPL